MDRLLIIMQMMHLHFGTPAQRRRSESAGSVNISLQETAIFAILVWITNFAAVLSQRRNNHDKILPIFKDERIRDTFSNVYGKRLRTLE